MTFMIILIKVAHCRIGQRNKGKTQYLVEEHADFSLETKAGELSEGEYKCQNWLALGLSLCYDIATSLEEKSLKHLSFLIGKIIKTSQQMKNRCEAPLSLSLFF